MIESNSLRQIILDTETTGMNQGVGAHYLGHRIIEIGAVELINRKLTGKTFHVYINPEQAIDEDAIKVHGITNDRVANEPTFSAIADDLMNFLDGAELIAHNAPFDVGFLNHEFSLMNQAHRRVEQRCHITDTLDLAKTIFPGQKNNLDALCKRYGIDNSHRTLHGALLDAEILSDVYLMMTGGQTVFDWNLGSFSQQGSQKKSLEYQELKVIHANADEMNAHERNLDHLEKSGTCLWRSD